MLGACSHEGGEVAAGTSSGFKAGGELQEVWMRAQEEVVQAAVDWGLEEHL